LKRLNLLTRLLAARLPSRARLTLNTIVAVTLIGLGLSSGALTVSAAQANSAASGSLSIALGAVTSLDPLQQPRAIGTAADSGRDLIENLFVGLTRYNPLTNQIEPLVAQKWDISSDNLTWTFYLRQDVQWVRFDSVQNKPVAVRPVTAGDFLYGLSRACAARSPRPTTNTLFIVAGCQTIAQANDQTLSDLFVAHTIGVQVVDQYTLQITLAFPAAYFPALLSLPEFRAVPREAIARSADWTQVANILTDGPWALAAWTPGQKATLVRNSLWPIPVTGNLSTIDVTFGQPPTADQVARLDHGSAPPKASVLASAPGAVYVLGFSAERTLTQPDTIRRALSLAIDRQAVIKSLPDSGSLNPLAASTFTPTDKADNSGSNPDAAKQALAISPIPGCLHLNELFDFVTDGSPDQTAIAQNLLDQWHTVLNCSPVLFTLETVSPEVLLQIVRAATRSDQQIDASAKPRPHLWLATWRAEYSDPNGWAGDGIHCTFGFLRADVPCDAADQLIDQAGTLADPAARQTAYAQAESMYFDPKSGTFPVAPLYVIPDLAAHPAWLSNLSVKGAFRFDQWTVAAH